jgi:hypothetical protein
MTSIFARAPLIGPLVGAALSIAPVAPHAALAHDPNYEYWRDYEVAFLDWCNAEQPTACQCVMEAVEAQLGFEGFARLVGAGVRTMAADPRFAHAMAAASPRCGGDIRVTRKDR